MICAHEINHKMKAKFGTLKLGGSLICKTWYFYSVQ